MDAISITLNKEKTIMNKLDLINEMEKMMSVYIIYFRRDLWWKKQEEIEKKTAR